MHTVGSLGVVGCMLYVRLLVSSLPMSTWLEHRDIVCALSTWMHVSEHIALRVLYVVMMMMIPEPSAHMLSTWMHCTDQLGGLHVYMISVHVHVCYLHPLVCMIRTHTFFFLHGTMQQDLPLIGPRAHAPILGLSSTCMGGIS